MWLILSLIFAFFSSANAPRWVLLGKQPYLPLGEWATVAKRTTFADLKSGRILLERKGATPLILLLDSPYALRGGKFVALPDAPLMQEGQILLSAQSAERLFPPILPEEAAVDFTILLQTARSDSAPAKEKAAEKAPAVALPSSDSCRPVKKIFLDPGHGGTDAGTKNGKIFEKNITLEFSRLAAAELRRRGFEVSFSRTRDVFLPLDIRTKLAEKWKADLFVSVHVNSSQHTDAHGTETYILNQDATDAEARKLALIENSIATTAKASQSAVQDILWDMEQTAYLQDSAYLASYIQGSLVSNAHDLMVKEKISGDWKNRGVRQAPFYVLNRAPMPAVLVELGYLSNPRDRKLLLTKAFQESLARALADGVKKYREECRKSQ